MNRVWCGVAILALAVTIGTPSGAEEKKDPSIKEIMTKAHKGGDSLIGKLGTELKAKEPDWATIQEQSKQLVELGTALGHNAPPKGTKESWEKLTHAYLNNARAMEAAAHKKDREETAADLKKVTGMCANCHKAHKGG